MPAAIFKIEQFIGVVLEKQSELFCQRHWLGKITDSVFNSWLFIFGAHERLLWCVKFKGEEQRIIIK